MVRQLPQSGPRCVLSALPENENESELPYTHAHVAATTQLHTIVVDGASVVAPTGATMNFEAPVLLQVVRSVDESTCTINGSNFGPSGTHIDAAYLYSPRDSEVVFESDSCAVVTDDTCIVCRMPVGVGNNLLWRIVIGVHGAHRVI